MKKIKCLEAEKLISNLKIMSNLIRYVLNCSNIKSNSRKLSMRNKMNPLRDASGEETKNKYLN